MGEAVYLSAQEQANANGAVVHGEKHLFERERKHHEPRQEWGARRSKIAIYGSWPTGKKKAAEKTLALRVTSKL